jgi:hypothetical protein
MFLDEEEEGKSPRLELTMERNMVRQGGFKEITLAQCKIQEVGQ